MTEELKKENMTLERLIELTKTTNKTYELYNILKRISYYIGLKEFNQELYNKFKSNISFKYELIVNNEETYDVVLIPVFLTILKAIFFSKNRKPIENKPKTKNNKSKVKTIETIDKEESLIILKNFISSVTLINNLIRIHNTIKTESSTNSKNKATFNKLPPSNSKTNTNNSSTKISNTKHISKILFKLLNFISGYFEECMILTIDNKAHSSFKYFSDLIVKNKVHLIITRLIVMFPNNHQCLLPSATILNKVLLLNKDQKELISKFIKTKENIIGFKSVFASLYDNSKYLNVYITLINSISEFFNPEELALILNLKLVNTIFSQYKNGGLQILHESLINYVKNYLLKRTNVTNNVEKYYNDETYSEIMYVFSNSLILILKKLKLLDSNSSCKWLFQCLTHINNIATIINNINPNNADAVNKICVERLVPQCIVEVLNALFEKKVFIKINTVFSKTDVSLLATKALLFRTLFHCISLVTFFNNKFESKKTFPKISAEKFYKVIKHIEDNDDKFSPSDLAVDFEKVSKDFF